MEQPPARRATWRLGTRERIRLQWFLVGIIIFLLIALVGRPYVLGVIQTRDFQVCQAHARKIAHGIKMYSGDWDETLPVAERWMDNTRGYMESTSGTGFGLEQYFLCPRDRSGAACSYAYNDYLSGLSLIVRPSEEEQAAQPRPIRRPHEAPLIIEKHGSALNAHLPLLDWAAVGREMTRPHDLPTPTGSLITGGGNVVSKNEEQLGILAGKRF